MKTGTDDDRQSLLVLVTHFLEVAALYKLKPQKKGQTFLRLFTDSWVDLNVQETWAEQDLDKMFGQR